MRKKRLHPERLHIYECLGPKLPGSKPPLTGFLGIWPEPPFYYLIFDRPMEDQLAQWLQSQPQWTLKRSYEMAYEQWQQISHANEHIGPFEVGSDFSDPVGQKQGMKLLIHPGLSFGTGLHPSTKGCLLSIARLWERVRVDSVVDLGTGTGILAMACARLGAGKVLGVDCNLLAVEEALENINANGLAGGIHLLVAESLGSLRMDADLLLMNLEWVSLVEVLRGEEWRRFPYVVVSGFMDWREAELRDLVESRARISARTDVEGWITLTLSTGGPPSF